MVGCPPAVLPTGSAEPVGAANAAARFCVKVAMVGHQMVQALENCAPKANEGELEPARHPADKFQAALAECRATAKTDIEYCVRMQKHVSPEISNQCGLVRRSGELQSLRGYRP